ncbi:trafficking protein particle complex [Lynx pardinus]|uniref:Trafficking protein particle complex n=1 Tax=Lynx pardinus TaxID=191816 RepID=A0A485MCQ6_LYNPA|nr:trafficking protein particle complex [Lynx pardinus]
MRVRSCDSLVLVNYPLYIRSAPTENELKFHYMVHTSLDVVDEKISAMGKALVDQRELYLGLLYPTEDYKVYPSHLAGAGPVGGLPTGASHPEIPPPASRCNCGIRELGQLEANRDFTPFFTLIRRVTWEELGMDSLEPCGSLHLPFVRFAEAAGALLLSACEDCLPCRLSGASAPEQGQQF